MYATVAVRYPLTRGNESILDNRKSNSREIVAPRCDAPSCMRCFRARHAVARFQDLLSGLLSPLHEQIQLSVSALCLAKLMKS